MMCVFDVLDLSVGLVGVWFTSFRDLEYAPCLSMLV